MPELIDLSQLPPGLKIRIADPRALERPEVQARLRELIERVRVNPLLKYYPHDKQQPFHAARRKRRVFLGGERSGKTVAGVLQDVIDAVDEESGGATGRSKADAPEIDGEVHLRDSGALQAGNIIRAKIEEADEHDLYGVPV